MAINLALGAFAGVVGAVLGGGAAAFSAWHAGRPVVAREVLAGALGGATVGFVGGVTLGLGLVPGVLGGEAGAVLGLVVSSLVRWRRPSGTEVLATAVAGAVAAGTLGALQPIARTAPQMVASGVVAGAGAGGTGQLTANVLDGRPPRENLVRATVHGGAVGGVALVTAMGAGLALEAVTRAPGPAPRVEAPASPSPSRGMIGALSNGRVLGDAEAHVLECLESSFGGANGARVAQAIRSGELTLRVGEPGSDPVSELVVDARPETMNVPMIANEAMLRGLTKLRLRELVGDADGAPAPLPAGATPAEGATTARAFAALERHGSENALEVWRALRDGRLVLRVGRPASEPTLPGQLRVDDVVGAFGSSEGVRAFVARALAAARTAD